MNRMPGSPSAIAPGSAILSTRFLGVIFDMDNVVANTEHLWDMAWTLYAHRNGYAWTHADSVRLQGMSVPEWSARLTAECGAREEPGNVANFCIDLIVDTVRTGGGPLRPGARELISYAAAHVPVGLATSSARPIMDTVLASEGVGHYFSTTVASSEVARGKPKPDVYVEAARRIGVHCRPAIGVEDSSNGIRAAFAAGLYVIAIPNRQFPPTKEALELADFVAANHAEALTHLKSLLSRAPQPTPPTA